MGISLWTSVAPSGHCAGKHHVWGYRMCQAMITKVSLICSELCQQQKGEHSLNASLSCGLYSLLSFLRVMSHLLSETIGSTDSYLTVPISALLIWFRPDNAVTRLSLSITSVAWKTSEYEITVLTCVPLLLWQGYWFEVNDLTCESLFLNIYLLMDPVEVLQQWDESLGFLHSHILLYSKNIHWNNWSQCFMEGG